MCGNGSKPDKMFQCVRCDHLQHTHCHSLDKILTQFILCDFCLEEKPHQWMRRLAVFDFWEVCKPYCFCTVCCKHFCGRCCPVSNSHQHANHPKNIIQVMHPGELLLVRPQDVNTSYDCSDIQPEIPDWVPLHPKPGTPLGGEKSCGFDDCHREIIEPYTFCSIYCKFKKVGWQIKALDTNMFVTGLLKREFIPGHRWDRFCLACRHAFSSGVCEHHDNHWPLISIMEMAGCLFARFMASSHSKWLGALSGIHIYREEMHGEVFVSVPLMPPPPQPDSGQRPMCCQCGNRIDKDMFYCSVLCMAKTRSTGELPDQ